MVFKSGNSVQIEFSKNHDIKGNDQVFKVDQSPVILVHFQNLHRDDRIRADHLYQYFKSYGAVLRVKVFEMRRDGYKDLSKVALVEFGNNKESFNVI